MADDLSWLETALARVGATRVAVLGDLAVDAYWQLEPATDELSLETGLPVERVASQTYGLGGAGNVAANLADLGVRVEVVGVVGDDPFGRELRRLCERRGIDTHGLCAGGPGWQTLVYGKPVRAGREQSRIDFGRSNAVGPELCAALAAALAEAAGRCDAVVVNQQSERGAVSPEVVERVNAVAAAHPDIPFVVDSRDRAASFRGVVHKLNAREAAEQLTRDGAELAFVTLGADGILVAEPGRIRTAPGIRAPGPTDPVGAGDTVVACVAAVLAAGGDAWTAARFANLAAAVTVRKLGTTGTATPAEILELAREVSP